MRFATWNVNSLKARLPRVEEFLGYADVDVLCLQETKLSDKTFPALTFSGLGYESVHNGQGQWNGVAILSRVGIENVTHGFDDQHVDPYEGDARVLAADCGGVRFVTVYVPNGREVGTEFYDRKLVWLQTLHDWLAATQSPDDPLVVLGDFNVAPDDRDLWDPKKFVGATHVTPPERDAVTMLEKWGTEDVFRRRLPRAPRDAHRPRARHEAGRRAGDVDRGRPQRPQGQAAVGPRAGDRRPELGGLAARQTKSLCANSSARRARAGTPSSNDAKYASSLVPARKRAYEPSITHASLKSPSTQ